MRIARISGVSHSALGLFEIQYTITDSAAAGRITKVLITEAELSDDKIKEAIVEYERHNVESLKKQIKAGEAFLGRTYEIPDLEEAKQ